MKEVVKKSFNLWKTGLFVSSFSSKISGDLGLGCRTLLETCNALLISSGKRLGFLMYDELTCRVYMKTCDLINF